MREREAVGDAGGFRAALGIPPGWARVGAGMPVPSLGRVCRTLLGAGVFMPNLGWARVSV